MSEHQKTDQRETLLLVDDEPGIRNVFGILLNDLGYDVLTAADGRQALELFRAHAPAIVLTDIKMPGMDGIQLLEIVKQEKPETEVIMITGHGDMDLAIKSLKMDATDFITKPINDDGLEIALKRAMDRIRMRRQISAYTKQLEQSVAEKESHLNQSRESYQHLFDQSPCYITVQDRDLRLTAANQRFTSTFAGRIGTHCYEAYKHRSSPCPDCPVEASFADGLPHQSEMQVTTKSGEQCHLFIATAPIRDDDGRVSQVIEMSTNITELRHLQDHLATLGLRVSSISHGVKGLLTNLDGGLYLLESGMKKDDRDKTMEGLDIVKFTADRIRRMILDILYFAKERDLQIKRTHLRKFCDDIASTFNGRLKGKAVEFNYTPAADDDDIELDASLMRTALLNILDNAADACRDDTSGRQSKIVFGMRDAGDVIVFDIVDNGIGMDKQVLENLFDLFFSSKGHRGTGLGLFVSHRIVTQHQGTIHVSSKKGQGAHFRVVLPKFQMEAGEGRGSHGD
jgi:signal transduction histidine kinase/FixJ family two-component response regulator